MAPVLVAPIITAGVVAGLLVAAHFYERLPIQPPPCGLRTLTGIPCIGCGGTRSMMSLAHGDFPQALSYNPLVALGAVGAIVWLVAVLIRLRFGRRTASSGLRRRPIPLPWIVALAVLLLAANWVYLILCLPE